MAVVLNELLQNVVDHAYPAGTTAPARPGTVRVVLGNDSRELMVRVIDDGVGLPEGFSVTSARGSGCRSSAALVTSDLQGTIDMFEPLDGRPGTVVELRVPLGA